MELELKGAIFSGTSDSEVISYVITASGFAPAPSRPPSAPRWTASRARTPSPSCARASSSPPATPLGFRPLCIGELPDGWAVASESCALDAIGARFVRDVEPGEVVTISARTA